jgi:general nucleoside transport system ATP-binding protein
MTSSSLPILRLKHISKRFGRAVANDDISLELARGEVLALLGENGAGKSTLVSILFGHYMADQGEVEAFGKTLTPGDPKAALAAGIGMVHQHFALADNLSVLDNVMLGLESLWRWKSSRALIRKRLLDACVQYGLQVEPDALVKALSVGERQRVEILKALVRGAKVLILDEPTAVLTPQESEGLFATLGAMVQKGLSIIFITHKLGEVMRVADRIAVLRSGQLIGVFDRAHASPAQLAELMVGRKIELPKRRQARRQARRLETPASVPVSASSSVFMASASGLTESSVIDGSVANSAPILMQMDAVKALAFQVQAGEILAIAGVAGNGQQELAHAVEQRRDWIEQGLARIPEDRTHVGVVGDANLIENAVLHRLNDPKFLLGPKWLHFLGFLNQKAMREAASEIVARFDVRAQRLEQPIRTLSGGNIQKFILGRELSAGPTMVIANQPTWGLDVGATAYIHQQVLDARACGAAVLLISEDLDEIWALADRVAVIFKGRLSEAKPIEDWTTASLGLAMAGQA